VGARPARGHRFPAEVISRAVWLCHALGPSLCDEETILAGRGVAAPHKSVRRRCLKLGGDFGTERFWPGGATGWEPGGIWARCSSGPAGGGASINQRM